MKTTHNLKTTEEPKHYYSPAARSGVVMKYFDTEKSHSTNGLKLCEALGNVPSPFHQWHL